MKELEFVLKLKNKPSAPLGKAGQTVDRFANNSVNALKRVGVGLAGLWATAKSLGGALKPAMGIRSALDELSTRGVGDQALDKIGKQAARFSTEFGTAQEDFINSVTAIRSALNGLSDAELPGVARAVNVLAVAMKTTGDQAAGYIAALAANFTEDVERMGRVHFAESFASKTAWLVRNTGQDMAKIQALINGAKGMGSGYGVGANEQLAVLGELSAPLGSGAGAVYEAFLKNAREGGKQLGVTLTDAAGRLLSFPDILEKLQAKYGSSVTGNIKLQEKLNKSFGKGAEALIKAWGSADKLRKNIKELQGQQGLSGAADMAAKISDIGDRLSNTGTRIKAAFGAALLPVFEPLFNWIIKVGSGFARWLEMFPNITRWLGYISILLAAIAGVASLVALAAGVKLVGGLLGLGKVLSILKFGLAGVTGALSLLNLSLLPTRIGLLALAVQARAVALWAGICKAAIVAWNVVLGVGAVAMKVYAAATALAGAALQFLMSPITLIVLAVAALAAGIWFVVTRWDSLYAAFSETSEFKALAALFEWLGEVVSGVWSGICAGWNAVINYFSGRSPLEVFRDITDGIAGIFTGLWESITRSFGKTYNWIVSKLNKLPGVNIEMKDLTSPQPDEKEPQKMSAPAGSIAPRIAAGGVAKALADIRQTDNSTNINELHLHPENRETFDTLRESLELAAS